MEDKKLSQVIQFSEVRDRIISELQKRSNIGITEPVTLIKGFVNQPVGTELSSSFILGGPTIPMIMLLGNESGRLYFFALKAILKDIDLSKYSIEQ